MDGYDDGVMADLKEVIKRLQVVSDAITRRTNELNADVMTMRNDPEIRRLWDQLCVLHMTGFVICEESGLDCEEIRKPQACITRLHLSQEETCCGRFLRRSEE